ncbi:MAG: DUF6049 family protein [Bifidobacteriaceae bacterium]|jgi:hypothetical protein|nr:DUF6049 family protein [Bifidobacteriaceae bacterium]
MNWSKIGIGAAVVGLLLPLAGPAAGTGPGAWTAATASSAPSIDIIASTAVLTDPGQTLTVTVRVDNQTGKNWRGNVNLSVAPDGFATREALAKWSQRGAENLLAEAWMVNALIDEQVPAGQAKTFNITATAARGPYGMNLGARGDEPGWGPRGVAASLTETRRGVVAAERTYVVYAPPEAVELPLNLSVSAGLTAAPGEQRERTLERLGRVAQATADPMTAWLVDPALLASEPAAVNADAEALVAAIESGIEAGKAIYMLPHQDIDEAVLARGGEGAAALVAAARQIGQSALSDAVGEIPAARTAGDLAWAAGPITSGDAGFMGSAGSGAVLLSPDQFSTPVDQAVAKRAGGPALVATDRPLTEALSAGGESPADVNRVLAESAWLAQRAQIAGDQAASAVVAMPRDWEPDPAGGQLLNTLLEATWVRPTALAAAINAPVEAELALTTDAASSPDLSVELVRELVSVTDRTMAFASLTPDPPAYLERSLPPLLAPLSNALTGPSRAASANVALTEAATAVPPVSVVAGSEVNLISEDGRVPVVVQNASNEPVTGLVVNLTPQTTAIQTDEPVSVDLEPGQSVTARVPVHAIANGVFRVQVDLLGPDGRPVAEAASLTMRVQAEWENLGTAIAGGVLALVLALGVFSTVRKRRAQARLRAAGAAGDASLGAGMDWLAGADSGAGSVEVASRDDDLCPEAGPAADGRRSARRERPSSEGSGQ